MADFENDLLGGAQPESNNFNNGDFEKVDSHSFEDDLTEVPEQDKKVTSTSFTGEEAEEDQYATGTTSEAEPASQPAYHFGGDPEPLINFGGPPISSSAPSGIREPTPPPAEPLTEPEIPLQKPLKTEPKDAFDEKEVVTPSEGWLKNIDPRVLELIYWRDPRKTGIVFGSMMFTLLSLSCFSVLSVVAYLSLAILAVTFSFRVYKNVLQAVQKTGDGHPFKQYLETEIEIPENKVQCAVQNILHHLTAMVREIRRLFLVEDMFDSFKFGLLLWVLTYIGCWFNGMTLVILGVVDIFTLPKIYEVYQKPIDNYLALAQAQFNKIFAQIQAKLPFLKKKTKTQ